MAAVGEEVEVQVMAMATVMVMEEVGSHTMAQIPQQQHLALAPTQPGLLQ